MSRKIWKFIEIFSGEVILEGIELKQLRENRGVTQPALAEYLGVSVRQIGNFENGKTPIKDIYAEKISSFFNIDGNNMEKNEMVTINLYEDVNASAGYGAYNSDIVPTKLQFDKSFLIQFFNITRFDNLDIIRVMGDSMLPLICDGEYIIVERSDMARSGDTVIANIDGELYVKRLKKVPYEKWLILESENQDYPSIKIDTLEKLEHFRIIGIVKSKIKLY